MAQFDTLSPELVEHVLLLALDGPSRFVQVDTLTSLGRVNQLCAGAAQRLLYRNIVLDTPTAAHKLLETLRRTPHLALIVRSLTFKPFVFYPISHPNPFTAVQQDAIVRLCTNLVHFDSPKSPAAPTSPASAVFPGSLRSLNYVPTASPGMIMNADQDSDDEQDHQQQQQQNNGTGLPRQLQQLQSLPAALTRLKLSASASDMLNFEPPANTPFPFANLESLVLDCLHLTRAAFEWIVAGSDRLRSLHVWLVSGITEESLVDALATQNDHLLEFAFKPSHGTLRKFISHDLVAEMSNLEKLTLGSGACNHTVYAKLPSSLTRLCISVPNEHQAARLEPIADEFTKRLKRVQRFELYSHYYYPPPVDIDYGTPAANPQTSQLREVRLSHLRPATGQLSRFLFRLGANVSTLALHQVNDAFQNLLPYCPNLKRLELGRPTHLMPTSPLFSSLHTTSLDFLRIMVTESDVSLEALHEALPLLSSLRTVELIARFPLHGVDAVAWHSGGHFDDLVEACKGQNVLFCVNGRAIKTPGALWKAICAGHSGRDAL